MLRENGGWHSKAAMKRALDGKSIRDGGDGSGVVDSSRFAERRWRQPFFEGRRLKICAGSRT
jgi:hypothetical protein